LNTLGQVYHGGAVVPVLLGMLLMVLVFSIERFLLFQKLVKTNLDAFMTKFKLVSNKVKLKKLSQHVTNNKVQLLMQLNQRYQISSS
jgi:hypothetical protein